MFKPLQPLLKGGATLCITMAAAADDKVRLTITRALAKDAKIPEGSPLAALHEPIVLTGTVDELDVELPGYLTAHVAKVQGLRSTFEALDKTLEEARGDAEKRIAAEKQRGQAKPGTPAAAVKAEPVAEPALF